VQQWLEHEYPAIEQRARAEGAEIHWGDETALVNTDVRGRSFAPRGKTPVARAVGGTREKLSMISTVTNQGRASWMIIDGAFNHERLNVDLKHAIGSKVPARTRPKLRAAAEQHMQFIEANPQRVRASFQAPVVRYAA
jgi:hypothetical protein